MSTEGGTARRVLTRDEECALSELSPFEFKSRLLELAAELRGSRPRARRGPGQPELGGDHPARRVLPAGPVRAHRVTPGLGGARPRRDAGAARASPDGCGASSPSTPGADGAELLRRTIDYGESLGFDADAFVYELVDGIIGDRYPGPRPDLRARRADPARVPRRRAARGHAAAGRLGPLRRRGRHRGDLLRVRLARRPTSCCAPATASR